MRLPTLLSVLLSACFGHALDVNFDDPASIRSAAKTIANNIVSLYGNHPIPGEFPAPTYWWESALAFDTLINHASLTGDDTYNDLVTQGLLWQIGSSKNYMPANQTKDEGNDDQSIWALACMTAAEKGFPDPPPVSAVASWLQLAQNVFDSQALRWDNATCSGGLHWQILTFNAGYNYKNALSNGNFMQLASRLYHYTGNTTYSLWADRAWQWTTESGLMQTGTDLLYDGLTVGKTCQANKAQWTANSGTYLSALAYMANITQTKSWEGSADAMISSIKQTFASTPNAPKDGIITEIACAKQNTCNNDQIVFRAILARAMANWVALAGRSNSTLQTGIESTLRASGEGAAAQCSGGKSGTTCGSNWAGSKWDGTQGLSQDLSALEIILANLQAKSVATSNGTSTSTSSGSGSGSGSGASNTSGAGHLNGMTTWGCAAFAIVASMLYL